MRLTDEEENQEDDVDDEFSERCLDLNVALRAVFGDSRAPQRCNRHTTYPTRFRTKFRHASDYIKIPQISNVFYTFFIQR